MARSNSVPLEKSGQTDALDVSSSFNNFNIHQIVSPDSSLLQFSKSLSANDFQTNQFIKTVSAVEIDIKPSILLQQMGSFGNDINNHSTSNNDDSTSHDMNNNANTPSPVNDFGLKCFTTACNVNSMAITTTSTSSTSGNREDKVCAVCGDRALGCNFDAVSCESCKAFFRRNAHKENKMKCMFSGHCYINMHTRRFCSYCRLKQCIAAGMRKDLILGVEEKRKRMELVKQNRKRKVDETPSPLSTSSLSSSPVSNHSNNSVVVATPVTSIMQSPMSSTSLTPPTTTPTTTTTSTTTTATLTTTLLTKTSPLIKHPPPPPTSYTLQPENTNLLTMTRHDIVARSLTAASQSHDQLLVRKLSAEECHMLIELNQVYDLSFTVDVEPLVHITQLNPSLNQIVNQSSITVLRLIKFAKRLDDFVKLTQDLQISLLKGCWFHLLLLRPVSLFDADRDVWATPKGDIPTEILKNATGYVDLHDDHIRYCRSLKALIGTDVTLLVILLVLVLFSPDGPHVLAPEIISNIQDRYLVLLKHYLEAKYTFKRSVDMFPQLLSKIRDLNSLVDTHAKVLMDINPQEIEPIMLEILDLKSC